MDYETGIGRIRQDFSGSDPVSLTSLGSAISMPAGCVKKPAPANRAAHSPSNLGRSNLRPQKMAGVKPLVQITQGLKPYTGQ
ncbi:hypothetical protein [Xanthomonas arboricola]|uniref:hypothetical protein n=1 Tax=Xanthomonas arboricola TaxID=56448 RepID=UPI0011858831|nr:hypothetical protein [Xanthomonas arboricola]